jgi:hypothetical protein
MFSVALTLMALSFFIIFAVAVGCSDAGVGRPCCTAGPGSGTDCVGNPVTDNLLRGMEGTSIVDNDLKCSSRICAWVQPNVCANAGSAECAAAVQVGTRQAECTIACNEDGDCPEGYVCARPAPVGPARCRPFCIRREYLDETQINPPSCATDDGGGTPMTSDVP